MPQSSHGTREPIALSWSGGKDSTLALLALRERGDVDVAVLLTSVTSEYDRVSIHGVRRTLLERQAEALGLPLMIIALEPKCSNAEYEAAFRDALVRLSAAHPRVKRVAFGDLYLTEVRDYRDRLLIDTGFTGMYPLWGEPTRALAEGFIDAGFSATIVCADNTQIDGSFAGRRFDRSLLDALPAGADPCGENGEFHTFVHDGPIFDRAVAVMCGTVVIRDERFTYCDLVDASSM